jgi:hypothetical protein
MAAQNAPGVLLAGALLPHRSKRAVPPLQSLANRCNPAAPNPLAAVATGRAVRVPHPGAQPLPGAAPPPPSLHNLPCPAATSSPRHRPDPPDNAHTRTCSPGALTSTVATSSGEAPRMLAITL